MAGLKETEKWENEIYRIEENDPVHGGEDGITNKPLKQLANRTKYLKTEVEKRYIAKDASTTQKGLVQLDSSIDSDAEDKAATPKAVNAVKALVIAVRSTLNNYIPNSKKSDAYNSSSSDTIATSYAVKKVRDIVENRFSSLANADGYKHVGRCKSVEMLRKVVPSKHGQRILVDAYYEGSTTGGGEFVADLQDLTTADDGGSCFVVLNNTARWKRIFDDRVDVVDFGAKSDEDATIAFENAFKYAGEHKKIITSEASTYFINKPLFLSGVGGIELNGKLYAKMTPENKSKPIITWAENAITLTQSHNNFINLVMWLEPTEDAPAICLAGLKSTNLKIGETGCVQIYATTEQTEQQVDFKGVEVSSTGYNRFDIDVLSTLHITGKGRGWVNENVINAQRFRALKAGFRAGILIDGEYRHNHNLIRRGCLEGGQTINIENGSSNTIEDARFERNPKNPDELLTISFSENAFSNRIIASWVSSPEFTNTPYGVHYDMVKVTDKGVDNVVSHIQETYSDEACLFALSQTTSFVSTLNKATFPMKYTTDIEGVNGIKQLISGSFKLLQNYAEVYKQSQFIHVRIGTMFDLSSDASHFRLGVELFDENKAPITTALDSHIKSGQLKVDGNKYKMDRNVSHANFTIISEQVRYVRVLITSGNDTENQVFDYLRFVVRYPKHFIEKSRGYHNIQQPIRKRSLFYRGVEGDIDMAEVGEGVVCYKQDLSEMKINLVRVALVINKIVGNVLIIEGLPVSGIKEHTQDSEQGWSLIYPHNDQEHKLAVERVAFLLSEKQTKIHIQGTIPSELRTGESIVLILTKTKKLA
ncbi:tail fiber protein [Pasteurella multocida]|uniref:tail fiber protein n=1 Tax=Pasteurella multocida TaxID=747 RepID=UPI002477D022|nr:tail fiber protein [Pasteurella multocida]MDH7440741.1 tail fiber protein [Pasteurella multocida]